MKTNNRFIILFTIIITLVSCGSPEKIPDSINFLFDFDKAKEIALNKNQPLIAVFYSQDCDWCKMLDDSTFTNKIVIEMSETMTFVKIDVVKDSLLTRKLGVSYYPTVIVFNSNGSEVDRLASYYPPSDFFNEIQLYLLGNETLDDYLVRLKDEPDRVEYHLIVAEKYRNRSDWNTALEYYTNVVRLDSDSSYELEQAVFEIAGIHQSMSKYSKAISAYRDFINRFPQSENVEDAVRRIPYCYYMNGDNKNAMTLYHQYLEDYSDGKYVGWVNKNILILKQVNK